MLQPHADPVVPDGGPPQQQILPPSPPVVWPVAVAVLIAGLLYLGTSVMVTLAFFAASDLTLNDLGSAKKLFAIPGLLSTSLLVGELSLLAPALVMPLLLRDAPQGLAARLSWHPGRTRAIEVLLLTIAALGLGHATQAASTMAGLWGGNLKDLDESVRAFSLSGLLVLLVPGAIGAGVCEEVLCRGLIQTRLVARFGPARGIGAAALFFGLLHMDPLHSFLAFLLGLLIGWAAWRTGSIVTGVIAHTLNNAISFVLSWAALEIPGSSDVRGLLSGLLLLGVCVVLLRREWKPHLVPA